MAKCLILLCLLVAVTFVVAGGGGNGYEGDCGNEYSPGVDGKRKRSAELGHYGDGDDGGNGGLSGGIRWTIQKRNVNYIPGGGGCIRYGDGRPLAY